MSYEASNTLVLLKENKYGIFVQTLNNLIIDLIFTLYLLMIVCLTI